jgi:hypothetical protein
MDRRRALVSRWYEVAPLLHRTFWRPLRNAMEIFHVLPLTAAAAVFILLATDGQFRELYVSYLEVPDGSVWPRLGAILVGLATLVLISVVICEAHFSLSNLRINVVYSSYSNPTSSSKLRGLQRSAAFCLTFVPWLGLTAGLFGARNFVADRYCKLFAEFRPQELYELHGMQHLALPGGWTIAAAIVVLGAAIAAFSCTEQQTRIPQRAVSLIAPSIAAVLFLLFTDWLVFSFADRWWQLFFIITAVATGLYFYVYQRLYRRRSGPIFSRSRGHAGDEAQAVSPIGPPKTRAQLMVGTLLSLFVAQPEFSIGVSTTRRRRQLLLLWAFMPWLLFALYFAIVPYFTASTQTLDDWSRIQAQVDGKVQTQLLCPIAATQLPAPGHWTVFPVAMCCTIALGLLVGLVLNKYSEQRKWRRTLAISVVVVLAAAAIVASRVVGVDGLVATYRTIGPLGATGLQLLFLISTFAILAWLSQRSGFPVLTLVVLAIVACVIFPNYTVGVVITLGLVCVVFAMTAFLSRLPEVGAFALILPLIGAIQWYGLKSGTVEPNPPVALAGGADTGAVKFKYECWLRRRAIAVQDLTADAALGANCPVGEQSPKNPLARTAGPYPVFIIAAEGGGIYAASAAGLFLAKMQQDAPHFADHVFAISGVSGGAIGSTIFHALHKTAPASSGLDKSPKSLIDEVTSIMEDDHLSPVVGAIFPEMLGAPAGRAESLVASFRRSVAASDRSASLELDAPFSKHWNFDTRAPALVLNATWVETGFRVAFAPFHLHDVDESLFSFSDEAMPDVSCPTNERQGCVTLIEAAAVSARFPLMLPPFSVDLTDAGPEHDGKETARGGPQTNRRWNFVDGGYVDNSGATTALNLYQALKDVAKDDVNLQIVLVTSSIPPPDFTKIKGTLFRDTLAPIDALMTVREDLGNDAVARACSAIPAPQDDVQPDAKKAKTTESNEACLVHGDKPGAHLHIVEIQDQTYGLSLGWKISKTSFDVVSWMLGRPSKCGSASLTPSADGAPAPPPDLSKPLSVPDEDANADLNNEIVGRNSCIMHVIKTLVEGANAAQNPADNTR